jgi:thymidylate kinase
VVELVGPAGAGKTTLARALPADVRADLTLWGLPTTLLMVGAVAVIPTVAAVARRRRPLRGPAISQMIRLRALRDAVERSAADDVRLVVLDEGPVFALSWLDVFHARDGDPGWARWRRAVIREWASRLDVVVRLDADDGELARRIRTREKPHPIKHCSDGEIFDFLARFRRAFDRVIAELRAAGDVTVLDLAPEADTPGEHAARLLGALQENGRGR